MSAGRNHIENDILDILLPWHIILQAKKALLVVQFISIQVSHVLLEISVNASFFDENAEVVIPFIVLYWILFSLVFQQLYDSFGQKAFEFVHESSVLEGLSGNIQRNILAVNDSLYESKEIW